jgi:hypothetical protein
LRRSADFAEEWSVKVGRPKKALFWLSLTEGSLRTTFYFTGEAKRGADRERYFKQTQRRIAEQEPAPQNSRPRVGP